MNQLHQRRVQQPDRVKIDWSNGKLIQSYLKQFQNENQDLPFRWFYLFSSITSSSYVPNNKITQTPSALTFAELKRSLKSYWLLNRDTKTIHFWKSVILFLRVLPFGKLQFQSTCVKEFFLGNLPYKKTYGLEINCV